MRRVAVLAGGRSPEHAVSLSSGQQVMQHLDARWEPWPVLLDSEGRWWPAPGPQRAPAPEGFRWPGMHALSPGEALHLLASRVDVVLPVLHGPFGEDGTVQGMLELHGVPFVGSGCAASAVAMDKIRTRECLCYHGVSMATAFVPRTPLARLDGPSFGRDVARSVGFPAFVKVDTSGSTLGVRRVASVDEAAAFVAEHRGQGRRVLAEEAIEGEEITVPVLGNSGDEVFALPPVGIYPRQDGYFTYAAKYTAALCEEVVPPRGLTPAQNAEAMALGVRCHEALQCDGMSRVDMIFTAKGPVVLEVNTIPGMTAVSLLPRAAAAAGIEFPALLDRLLELALRRWPRREAER